MASSTRYIIEEGYPTAEQYRDIRRDTGMTPPAPEHLPEVDIAFSKSLIMWVIRDTESPTALDPRGAIVGMGRLVGDLMLFIQVVDICVLPEHQRKGLAGRLMDTIVKWCDEHAPNSYVNLMADLGAVNYLYPKYGFRDVSPSLGMYRCARVDARKEEQKKRLAEEAAKQ